MVDLNKIKSIKVRSDGTSGGTVLTTSEGDVISTVVGLQYLVKAEEAASRLRLEVVLPALELDIPIENVDLEIASIRYCPGCAAKLSPNITSRKVKDEEDRQEAIVVYECKACDLKRVYPFTFEWDSVPKDLEDYQDAKEDNEEETNE